LYAPPVARRLFVYFLPLITGTSLLGIIGTKRLLLISAWAVLPVGLYLETLQTRPRKAFLLAFLLVIAGVGWFGTVARRFYAAPQFIEHWNKVAVQMAFDEVWSDESEDLGSTPGGFLSIRDLCGGVAH
jgi:hypothetical protein